VLVVAQQVLNTTKSPLAAISVLKKICDHPCLLYREMQTLKYVGMRDSLVLLPRRQNQDISKAKDR